MRRLNSGFILIAAISICMVSACNGGSLEPTQDDVQEETVKFSATTGEASSITFNSAVISGSVKVPKIVSGDMSLGIMYSTSEGMIKSNSKEVIAKNFDSKYNFDVKLDSLEEGVLYYYKAFVQEANLYYFGDTKSFETLYQPYTVNIDQTSASIPTGCELQLSATASPESSFSKNITWSSSDESIVSVSQEGLVKGLKVGKAVVTASSVNGSSTCDIEVVNPTIYLTFTSSGTNAMSLVNKGDNCPYIVYSYDLSTWTQWDYSRLEFSNSKPVYLMGNNPDGFSTSSVSYSRFTFSERNNVFCEGSVMSLISPVNDVKEIPNAFCFYQLFFGCAYLESAPTLPATTLKENCYTGMFSSCHQLSTAPELPATELADGCYAGMFSACALTTAPELPATTLAEYCYSAMFQRCSQLTKAPKLPATTLSAYCYNFMFYMCSALNYIEMLATDISADSCLKSWTSGVAGSGIFVKNASATWDISGVNGVPTGWTFVRDPLLPAGKYKLSDFSSVGFNTLSQQEYDYDIKCDYIKITGLSSTGQYCCIGYTRNGGNIRWVNLADHLAGSTNNEKFEYPAKATSESDPYIISAGEDVLVFKCIQKGIYETGTSPLMDKIFIGIGN